MLSREEVVAAFWAALDRAPESERTVELHRRCPDVAALGRVLRQSDEFATTLARRRLDEAAQPNWVRKDLPDGTSFWVDLHDHGVSAGILRGAWEPTETNFMLSLLRPGDNVLDIGANLGWYAVHLARAVGPDGHVHAFEPRSDLFRWLRRNVADNGMEDRCTLHNLALGAAEGTGELVWDPAEVNPGHSYLSPSGEPRPGMGYQSVRVAALDGLEMPRRVRLLKIDVEGAEPDVLRGAMGLLRRDQPIIVTEMYPRCIRRVGRTEPTALLRLLEEVGYRAYFLTDDGIGGEARVLPSDLDSDYLYYPLVFLSEADHAALLDERRNDRIRELEAELAAARASPKAESASGGEEFQELREQVRSLSQALDAAKRRAQSAELRNADLAAQIIHFPPPQATREELDAMQLQAELEAVRHSTSWKLTAPLRLFGRRIKR